MNEEAKIAFAIEKLHPQAEDLLILRGPPEKILPSRFLALRSFLERRFPGTIFIALPNDVRIERIEEKDLRAAGLIRLARARDLMEMLIQEVERVRDFGGFADVATLRDKINAVFGERRE